MRQFQVYSFDKHRNVRGGKWKIINADGATVMPGGDLLFWTGEQSNHTEAFSRGCWLSFEEIFLPDDRLKMDGFNPCGIGTPDGKEIPK